MFLVNCVVLFVLSYTIYMALSIYFLKGSCFQICEERAHIREEEIELRRGAGGEPILSSISNLLHSCNQRFMPQCSLQNNFLRFGSFNVFLKP